MVQEHVVSWFVLCSHHSHLRISGFFNCVQKLQQMLGQCRRSTRGAFTQLFWNWLRSTLWLLIFYIFYSAVNWNLLWVIRSYGEGNFVVPLDAALEHPLLRLLGFKLAAYLMCIGVMTCSRLTNLRISWQYLLQNAHREKDSVVLRHANDPRLSEILNQHSHQNNTVVPYNNALHVVTTSTGQRPDWRLLDGFLTPFGFVCQIYFFF